jgi:hypothetical protein
MWMTQCKVPLLFIWNECNCLPGSLPPPWPISLLRLLCLICSCTMDRKICFTNISQIMNYSNNFPSLRQHLHKCSKSLFFNSFFLDLLSSTLLFAYSVSIYPLAPNTWLLMEVMFCFQGVPYACTVLLHYPHSCLARYFTPFKSYILFNVA